MDLRADDRPDIRDYDFEELDAELHIKMQRKKAVKAMVYWRIENKNEEGNDERKNEEINART